MSKFLNGLLFVSVIALAGCGSGNGKQTDNVALTFYLSESDYYLQITDSGDARYFKCSINDGYVPIVGFSGKYQGDQLTTSFFGEESSVTLTEIDGIYTGVDEEGEITTLDKVNEVPASCANDAIEITSFSPENAIAGVESEFVVNYDYRFLSSGSAFIFSGLVSPHLGGIPFSKKIELSSGTSSGSFTTKIIPINAEELDATLTITMFRVRDSIQTTSELTSVFASSSTIGISAPTAPIRSQSYMGSWAKECINYKLSDGDTQSANGSLEISGDTIVLTNSYYSDKYCIGLVKSSVRNFTYVDKGKITDDSGLEARLLEIIYIDGDTNSEPFEQIIFAYNNTLVYVFNDDESDNFSFGQEYKLEN